jgi:predicted PurR-regulated permease PerM
MTDRRSSGAPAWLPRAVLTVALVVLGVVAALWVVGRLRGLLFMVFVSLFLAVALEPAVQFLTRLGWRRGLATAVVLLVTILLGLGFLAALLPLFVAQASTLIDELPGYLEGVQEWLDGLEFLDVELFDEQLTEQLEGLGSMVGQIGGTVAGGALWLGTSIANFVFQVITILLFTYYMVAEGPKMRRTVLSFLAPDRQREALRVWEIAVAKTGGYIYSRMVLALVAAGFTAVVLTVLGLDYVLALSLWVGLISQFVPVVGTYIAMFLPALVAVVDRPIKALWVIAALTAYQQIENYFVAPRITARTMAIHPAVSIGAVIAGASLMGPIGAVLALPVAAIIQAVASTAANRHDLIDDSALHDDGVGPDPVEGGGPPGPMVDGDPTRDGGIATT